MNKRKYLSFISALTLGLTSLSFTNIYAVAEDKAAVSTDTEDTQKAKSYYVFYKDIDTKKIDEIVAEKDTIIHIHCMNKDWAAVKLKRKSLIILRK